MAKKLSDKVIHCPECGVLKSKSRPCKRCGFGEEEKTEVKSIRLKLADTDMSKYDSVVINGIAFHK